MKTNKDAVVFTDAKGREWRPSLNVRVIKEFEQKSGLDFFGTVLDVIIDMQKRLNTREDMKLDAAMFKDITNFEMVQIFRKFFGNVGNLAFLLYEGCRRESTGIVVDAEGEEVAFEDFCQSIDEAHLQT